VCDILQQDNYTDSGMTLLGMLDKVMRQVEYHCFVDLRFNRIDPLYKELCLIIAEAFLLRLDSTVRINGSLIHAQLLKEVYSKLTHEHLRLVFDNFHNVVVRVYNKKAYLRTALYNAVFELESSCINDFGGIVTSMTDGRTD
jgi:hypothetical protein